MNTFLISLCYVMFGALSASCLLCALYLLLKGLYLSFFKFKKPLNKPIDTLLQCSPNKILVLNEVSYKCVLQQHDSFNRCSACSLDYLLEDCLSVDCMPEVKGEFKFYKLLKQ